MEFTEKNNWPVWAAGAIGVLAAVLLNTSGGFLCSVLYGSISFFITLVVMSGVRKLLQKIESNKRKVFDFYYRKQVAPELAKVIDRWCPQIEDRWIGPAKDIQKIIEPLEKSASEILRTNSVLSAYFVSAINNLEAALFIAACGSICVGMEICDRDFIRDDYSMKIIREAELPILNVGVDLLIGGAFISWKSNREAVVKEYFWDILVITARCREEGARLFDSL